MRLAQYASLFQIMLRSSNESLKGSLITASLAAFAMMLFVACSKQEETTETKNKQNSKFDPSSLVLTDPNLIQGREIWMKTCTTCHLGGLTGAPIIGNKSAWAPRIEKGIETLFDHALNGFVGPKYTEMPPKGGFSDLSDQEVKQAVLFMVEAAKQ